VPSNKTRLAIDFDYLIKNQIKVVGSFVSSINDAKETLEFSAEHNVLPIV
jgi:D-arabinose 1-dehydrogenase-like Zn-dependent alcohol dehydrogenase